MAKFSFKNILLGVTGLSLLRKQKNYAHQDYARWKEDAQSIYSSLKAKPNQIDEWNTLVLKHGIQVQDLKQQYRYRRILACFLLIAIICLSYFLMTWHHPLTLLAGILIVTVFYLNNALRLFQLRQRYLCSLPFFIKAACVSFKEWLPLPLPANWDLISKNNGV